VVGAGTTVTVLLPRSASAPVAPRKANDASQAPAVPDGAASRGEVLLVEDDPEVAALAREMLGVLGFGIIHVTNAVAALGALGNGRPLTAMFADIMIPGGISGLDLAREVRRRQPQLVIALTTGYRESAASLEDGEFRLLLKPYSLEALGEALGVRSGAASRDGT
jgi:CheY-like chemotaxis protein